MGWYAVRCVFATGYLSAAAGHTYEERITLWQAGDAAAAIRRAEAEAEQYAGVIDDQPDTFLGLSQSYSSTTNPVTAPRSFP